MKIAFFLFFFLYSSLDRDDSRDLDYSSCSSSSPAAAVSNMVAGGGGAAASLPVLENPENQVIEKNKLCCKESF